jgi:pimeloyl-ACP methyl ester carboxylesterase
VDTPINSRHDQRVGTLSQPRRPLHRGVLRALLNVLAVVALIVAAGMTAQAWAEQSERGRFPPPGRLVDVGHGQFIHLRQWGETNGGPTVVLDISAAMPSSVWAWVGPPLADRGYRVVAYDRPGMAWSYGTAQPRDARHAAEALRTALDRAAVTGPYVVVAHSYGAFSSRVFTGMNRDRVTALALLDSTHPHTGGPVVAVPYRLQAWLGHTGLFQIAPPPNSFTSLPADEVDGANAVSHWTTHLDASAEELEEWDASAQQVQEFPSFGDLPVLVVSTSRSGVHFEQQQDLLEISTASRLLHIDADHMGMLLSQPNAEQIVGWIDELSALSK